MFKRLVRVTVGLICIPLLPVIFIVNLIWYIITGNGFLDMLLGFILIDD